MNGLKQASRLGKILCGVGFVGGSAVLLATQGDEEPAPVIHKLTTVQAAVPALGVPDLQKFGPSIKWDYNWDRREPSALMKPPKTDDEVDSKEYQDKLKQLKSTASRNIILIRHGQYNINQDGDENRTLTNLGKSQAVQTGKRLAELGYPYKSIVYSTMTRARETASIISESLPGIPMFSCELIREGAPYPPEPSSKNWKPAAKFFEDGARIEAGFRKHFYRAPPNQIEDSYEVIVCHANVIRYYVCRALQLPPEAWLRMSLHNGSITWLVVRPSGSVGLRVLGDCGFMPKDMMTTT